MKTGDVVRYDRVWSVDIPDDPAWFLVTSPGRGTWVHGGGFKRADYSKCAPGAVAFGVLNDNSIARREIVPPEEWPDEVCVALAKLALVTDPNEIDGRN